MDGFNYLPGAFIVPHFDELPRALLSGFLPLAGKYTLVGIDGNTALVCNGQGCQVRGQGAVTVVRHAKPVRYVQER
jgi:cyanophycinase-like exopeptidase